MEPLKEGILAQFIQEAVELLKNNQPDMSVASWRIRFATFLKNVMVVLSGMSNMEQGRDNLEHMERFETFKEDKQILLQDINAILKKEQRFQAPAIVTV